MSEVKDRRDHSQAGTRGMVQRVGVELGRRSGADVRREAEAEAAERQRQALTTAFEAAGLRAERETLAALIEQSQRERRRQDESR